MGRLGPAPCAGTAAPSVPVQLSSSFPASSTSSLQTQLNAGFSSFRECWSRKHHPAQVIPWEILEILTAGVRPWRCSTIPASCIILSTGVSKPSVSVFLVVPAARSSPSGRLLQVLGDLWHLGLQLGHAPAPAGSCSTNTQHHIPVRIQPGIPLSSLFSSGKSLSPHKLWSLFFIPALNFIYPFYSAQPLPPLGFLLGAGVFHGPSLLPVPSVQIWGHSCPLPVPRCWPQCLGGAVLAGAVSGWCSLLPAVPSNIPIQFPAVEVGHHCSCSCFPDPAGLRLSRGSVPQEG